MAKGIIYIMTTVVPGLIKIGKTGVSNFESRMYQLERHGYTNVTGLKRHFAIEVDDYDEKELLLQEIFSKSRLQNSELFALDVKIAVQLLSSFEGKQIYPKDISKDDVFDNSVARRKSGVVPDGLYYFSRKIKRWDNRIVEGTMRVENGKYILQKGSICCPIPGEKQERNIAVIDKDRERASIVDNILQADIEFKSPSAAGSFLIYSANDGWRDWKTANGEPISKFREL